MTRILLCICFAMISMVAVPTTTTANEYTRYEGEIPHFFTHCLIAYPNLAFARDNPMRNHYRKDCITATEFQRFLEQMHDNHYALYDIQQLYSVDQGRIKKMPTMVPRGKKPFVLSFDDVIYDSKKMHRGMVDRLDLDRHGAICSVTNAQMEYDKEFVPILETFIQKHPDFSIQGARATIFFTGYDGILGYRTQHEKQDYLLAQQHAKDVLNYLSNRNWRFGCHSYGHYHNNLRSDSQLTTDTEKWLKEVAPLCGHTTLYAYPYGEWDKTGAKQTIFMHAGFSFFFGVGIDRYFVQKDNYLFMDRQPLDGYTLQQYASRYQPFFDANQVLTNAMNDNS